MQEVKKFFKPEFLNRLDDTIVFHYLEAEHVKQITRLFIHELTRRMQNNGITLKVDDAALAKLASDGFDPVYGAEPGRCGVKANVKWKILLPRILCRVSALPAAP